MREGEGGARMRGLRRRTYEKGASRSEKTSGGMEGEYVERAEWRGVTVWWWRDGAKGGCGNQGGS